MALFTLEISMSLWPDKCSFILDCVTWKRKNVPRPRSYVSVDGEQGKRERWGWQLWGADGAGHICNCWMLQPVWGTTLPPSLPPQLAQSLNHRASQRACGDLMKRSKSCKYVKHWCCGVWFFLKQDFTSLGPNYVPYELEVTGRNPDLNVVCVNFMRNFKCVI